MEASTLAAAAASRTIETNKGPRLELGGNTSLVGYTDLWKLEWGKISVDDHQISIENGSG